MLALYHGSTSRTKGRLQILGSGTCLFLPIFGKISCSGECLLHERTPHRNYRTGPSQVRSGRVLTSQHWPTIDVLESFLVQTNVLEVSNC